MTERWKMWKTKKRFPTVPTVPWKSPKARFPHSHRPDGGDPCIEEKENAQRRPSGAKKTIKERSKFDATTYYPAPPFQAHPVLG